MSFSIKMSAQVGGGVAQLHLNRILYHLRSESAEHASDDHPDLEVWTLGVVETISTE